MAVTPQNPTPRLRALDSTLEARQRAEDKVVAPVIKGMLSQSNELFERIQRRINRLDVDKFGNIKSTNKNLSDVNDINALLNQGANLITNQAIREFKNLTFNFDKFYTKEILAVDDSLNQDQIAKIIGATQTRAVLNTNLDNMKSVSSSFVQDVRRQLNSTLFENIGAEEMASRLKESLVGTKDKRGNPMTRHADTISKTAYNAYANALTFQNVNLNDVVAYYYSGVKDDKNRHFCSIRVDKVLEKEQLEKDIQGQSGGTIHNAGGWNCRHKLFPISKFDEEAKPFLSDAERMEIFGE